MFADDVVKVIASGGGVNLSTKGLDVRDLVRIAATGKQYRRTVVIRDAAPLMQSLTQIAVAGEGNVIFEF